jgi:glycosyltransferase involved in cell wall biosynthesis
LVIQAGEVARFNPGTDRSTLVDLDAVAHTNRVSRQGLLSVVIPALNEARNIFPVFTTIPVSDLSRDGWDVEIIVVDNGSTDGTGDVAVAHGAKVVTEPLRGYGNAYRAGFAAASGDVIATGDADCTYPFDALCGLLAHLETNRLDFLSTNRLGTADPLALTPSHLVANHVLTTVSRSLFRSPFQDSQSGMWVFRRHIWPDLDVRARGMAFSQEIKHEAYLKGYRCGEAAISYRVRHGDIKLNACRDGIRNLSQLFAHRVRGRRRPLPLQAVAELGKRPRARRYPEETCYVTST